ncbi:AAA family ATPase [Lelliottia wanjuensis]|uniref:AAA family ATPase n=1 Tax=Lelliottia wanjuensis TaxID=3050585 RepID=UPI00254C75C8|nr:AAA family ATPase [Lelliottia sp. V104_15]MDK9603713.1 AAA family ATPase [Lelliottia sp. V104_15]
MNNEFGMFTKFDIKKDKFIKVLKKISTKDIRSSRVENVALVYVFCKAYLYTEYSVEDSSGKLKSKIEQFSHYINNEGFRNIKDVMEEFYSLVSIIARFLETNVIRNRYSVDKLQFPSDISLIRDVFSIPLDDFNPKEMILLFDCIHDDEHDLANDLMVEIAQEITKKDSLGFKVTPLINDFIKITSYDEIMVDPGEEIDFFLGLSIILHNSKIRFDTLFNNTISIVKYNDSPIFRNKFKMELDDIYSPTAILYYSLCSQVELFKAIIVSGKKLVNEEKHQLLNSGYLRAVIELPKKYKAKQGNIYVLDSSRKLHDEVLFIKTDHVYDVFDNDKLFMEFISSIISFENEYRLPSPGGMEHKTELGGYIRRFFPSGYNNVPGLVHKVRREEIYSSKSFNVDNFVEKSTNSQEFFSILDYRLIYNTITNDGLSRGNYIIGNNGVGKSFLLSKVAEKLVDGNDKNVILVSFGFTDRFYSLRHKTKYYGDRKSNKIIRLSQRSYELSKNMLSIYDDSYVSNIFEEVLKHVGFTSDLFCVPANFSAKNKHLYDHSNIVPLSSIAKTSLDKESYRIAIRKYQSEDILMFDTLSSGEQHLLIMFSRILCNISRNDVIIIDEPEISMHVEWQQKLPSMLDIISERFDSPYLVATHSPILINSVNLDRNFCFIAEKGSVSLIDKKMNKHVEAILFNSFDIVTKHNRSIYEHCASAVSDFMSSMNHDKHIELSKEKSLETLDVLEVKLESLSGNDFRDDLFLIQKARLAITELYSGINTNNDKDRKL